MSESSTGRPLFPPGSPAPQIRFRGVDCSLVGGSGSEWAALVVQLLQPERGRGQPQALYLARPWNATPARSPSNGWALIIDLLAHLSGSFSPQGGRRPLNPLRGSKGRAEQLKPRHPGRSSFLIRGPPGLGLRGWALGPGFTQAGPPFPGTGGEWTRSGRAEWPSWPPVLVSSAKTGVAAGQS